MKANCHTCKHDLEDPHGIGGRRMCALVAGITERGDDMYETISAWLDDLDLDALDMPPTDADGCPGYEAAAPMMGEPGGYTAQHVGRLDLVSPTIDPLIAEATRWDAMTRAEQAANIAQRMIDGVKAVAEYLATHGPPDMLHVLPVLPHNSFQAPPHIGARGGHQRTATNPVHVRA